MGALTVTRETFLIVVVAFQRTRYYTSRVCCASFSLIHVEGKPRERERERVVLVSFNYKQEEQGYVISRLIRSCVE